MSKTSITCRECSAIFKKQAKYDHHIKTSDDCPRAKSVHHECFHCKLTFRDEFNRDRHSETCEKNGNTQTVKKLTATILLENRRLQEENNRVREDYWSLQSSFEELCKENGNLEDSLEKAKESEKSQEKVIEEMEKELHLLREQLCVAKAKSCSFCQEQKKTAKKKIPVALRRRVWNKFVGEEKGKGKCWCCKTEIISQSNFVRGHILSEKEGGELALDNLRPICVSCNSSMGDPKYDRVHEKNRNS